MVSFRIWGVGFVVQGLELEMKRAEERPSMHMSTDSLAGFVWPQLVVESFGSKLCNRASHFEVYMQNKQCIR